MAEAKENTSVKLTKRQEFFCRNYVANGHNGTQAAIDAGYSKNTAAVQATENIRKPNIIAFIEQLEKPAKDKLGLDENWVLTKLKRFAETNLTDFFEIKTQKISVGKGKRKREIVSQHLVIKDLKKLPRELTDCLQEISQTQNGIKLKLVEKRMPVVDIGKTFGQFVEKIDANVKLPTAQFDVSKLTNDDVAQLSNMLKRIQQPTEEKQLIEKN